MHYPRGRILVFSKAPVAGRVKTRLQPALSADQCARLQQQLIERTLKTVIDSRLAPAELWCADTPAQPFFRACRDRHGLPCYRQRGADLGDRMAHALHHALSRAAFAILIGTDCPGLEARHLAQAAAHLANTGPFRHNAKPRVVLAPAADGGYVLVGSNRPVDWLFNNIDWGGPRVFRQTLAQLQKRHTEYKQLETLWDIDRPHDLKHLPPSIARSLMTETG